MPLFARLFSSLILGLALLATLVGCNGDDNSPAPVTQQSIKHVFVITMENKSFSNTFGSSTQDPYVQSLATKRAPSSTSTPSSMTRRIATAMSST
jgi:phospholipase C